jgi:hypothetical protein
MQGTVAGDGFATAFLAIWLGAQPTNPGLKPGLLDGAVTGEISKRVEIVD